jgi:hypothetical protein
MIYEHCTKLQLYKAPFSSPHSFASLAEDTMEQAYVTTCRSMIDEPNHRTAQMRSSFPTVMFSPRAFLTAHDGHLSCAQRAISRLFRAALDMRVSLFVSDDGLGRLIVLHLSRLSQRGLVLNCEFEIMRDLFATTGAAVVEHHRHFFDG